MMTNRIGSWMMGAAVVCVCCVLIAGMGQAQDQGSSLSPEGFWQTVPDDEGSPSVVHIWIEGGQAFGKVIKIYPKPGKNPDPICDQCTGDLKDQRIIGMTILTNLSQKDKEWSGGQILDPNNGKVYKCYIKVIEDGAKLKVRGYIGFSMLGRTQNWIKVEKPI